MDDLHRPLGQDSQTTASDRRAIGWRTPATVLALIAALSAATYWLVDAKPENPNRVAINEASGDGERPGASSSQTGEQGSSGDILPDIDEPVTDAKSRTIGGHTRLSPLEPLDNGANQNSTIDQPGSSQPGFQPNTPPKIAAIPGVPLADLVEKSEFGLLPKVNKTGVRPLDAYSQSSGTIGANRVAIVVGGLGLSQTGTLQAIQKLPSSVTLGFSPFGNSLQRWMQMARKEGHEVVLQLPMEPLGYPSVNPGPRTLVSGVSPGQNIGNLRWSLGRMTNYPIVMNYLGAGLMNKEAELRPILSELKARGLGYLDDGTVEASLAVDIAKDLRLPHLKGTMVIDERRDDQAIQSRLLSVEGVARRQGYAVATATAFPDSIDRVIKWVEEAPKRGVLIVPLSNLIKDYSR